MFAKRYRFLIAFLLFIAGIINYMDRAALGVAAPFVKEDLNLSPSELGVIFSTLPPPAWAAYRLPSASTTCPRQRDSVEANCSAVLVSRFSR